MLAAAAWIAQGAANRTQQPVAGGVRIPVAGSSERRAILDALRRQLRAKATFKVTFVAAAGTHAFVRAGEVVRDGDALQETDLFVEALLVKGGESARTRWRVLEWWDLSTQPTDEQHRAFLERVHQVVRARHLAPTLLPPDLRTMARQ